jgi:hypothetical protein
MPGEVQTMLDRFSGVALEAARPHLHSRPTLTIAATLLLWSSHFFVAQASQGCVKNFSC